MVIEFSPETIVMHQGDATPDDPTQRLSIADGQLIAAHPDEWRDDPAGVLLAGRRFAVAFSAPRQLEHRPPRHPAGRRLAPVVTGGTGYARPAFAQLIPIPPVQVAGLHPLARAALSVYQERVRTHHDHLVWKGDTIVVGGVPFVITITLAGDEFVVGIRSNLDPRVYPDTVQAGRVTVMGPKAVR